MPTDRTMIGELMDRASSGDNGAFGELALAVRDELFRLALALGLAYEDAAEAAQEALLRAYAGRARWKSGSDAMAWLCGITMNVVREQRRKERRKATWLDGQRGELAAAGPEEQGLDGDEVRRLAEALNELPARQREAVACRYLRRRSIRQTAEAMGCAEGTVKSAVFAGLKRLRTILEQDG
ncbi:MAG: RNA polymerase sigma factor [Phycisphaerae bacterium]